MDRGPRPAGLFGPFIHQINKGGLEEIKQTSRLRSTTAAQIAGGMDAVRATRTYEGADHSDSPRDRPIIVFYADVKPKDRGPPGCAEVWWYMPEGEYLDIWIDGVYGEQ